MERRIKIKDTPQENKSKMLKAMIFSADSVDPNIIFKHMESFPFLNQMISKGAFSSYSAYVQKGYQGSYSSEQNWASIYTGLSPSAHQINTNRVRNENRSAIMQDFAAFQPFWQILNEHGYCVGLWGAVNCNMPCPINGYTVSVNSEMLSSPVPVREIPRKIQLCEKDTYLKPYFDNLPPDRRYPKTLIQQGYTFQQLMDNPDLAEEALKNYCFEDAIPNFEEELSYWFTSMKKVQKDHPADVLYLYTPTTDLIAHCCMCSEDNPVLIAAYQLLDCYIGKFIEEFQPEIMMFLSDHGQQNFKDLIPCKNPVIQREAFSAREDVIWLKNGYIAFEARNGALLFTAHALKGAFIVSGPDIRHTCIHEMRTLDIYPTLLEMFGIKVPEGRNGYVQDIFTRPVINADYLFPAERKRKQIAFIQTHKVSLTDIMLNELYNENRFADITVAGEAKYMDIFLGNPRIAGFIPFDEFDSALFDEVYCGFYNADTNLMKHIKISGKNNKIIKEVDINE